MRLDVFLSHDLNIVKSAMLHCNQRNNPKGLIRTKARTFAPSFAAQVAFSYLFGSHLDTESNAKDNTLLSGQPHYELIDKLKR